MQEYVTYEAFGAVGDGKHDDLSAIVKAHAYANEQHLPVKARDHAVYYIGGSDQCAVIRTNTDFGKAEFIIDDTNLENLKTSIFHVASDQKAVSICTGALPRDTKKLDVDPSWTKGRRCFVEVFSDQPRVYIRKGLNQNKGVGLGDCFLIEPDGTVLNELNWDFAYVEDASLRPEDTEPLLIEGGIFTTIANQAESFYNYHGRGIEITRDHTTVRNIRHYVQGELDHGAPYKGFLSVERCSCVTLENCLLTPHFTYWTASQLPGQLVPMGTYEINANRVIGLTIRGIKQTIDIMDRRYWGLMGSNFCRDIVMEDCVVSRFDAHMGVTNLVLRRCRLGHQCLNLIGRGTAVIEDTYAFGNSFVNLREDYGSFFTGTLILRRNTWKPRGDRPSAMTVIHASNTGEHDFGYECCMPEKIVIDGLCIEDGEIDVEDAHLYILPDYDPDYAPGKPYAYVPAHQLELSGVAAQSGRTIACCARPEEYPDLCVTDTNAENR